MVGGFGSAGCGNQLGFHPRRGLTRTTRLLSAAQRASSALMGTQVLLLIYLRVLLQPLRRYLFSSHYSLQTSVSGLAGLSDRGIRAGLDSQSLYEPVRAVET